MVSIALIVLSGDVTSRINSGTTKEVHDTVWIASGELRG
jgi:hypothetical protein